MTTMNSELAWVHHHRQPNACLGVERSREYDQRGGASECVVTPGSYPPCGKRTQQTRYESSIVDASTRAISEVGKRASSDLAAAGRYEDQWERRADERRCDHGG